jgi:hypothetical protein
LGEKTNGPMKAIEVYRQLQLLEGAWNSICQYLMQMLYLVATSSLFIISVYSSIKFVNEIPLSAIFLLAAVYTNSASCIVVGCNTAANVHTYSREVIYNWKVNSRGLWRVRKLTKACAPLKIKLGTNFIDILNPLVIMDLVINQTVSLLIIS